jgi:hypothetical protein
VNVRRTLMALTVAALVAMSPATAEAGGRPHGMTPAAYRALIAKGQAFNARYGQSAVHGYPASANQALLERSQALNDRYGNAVTRLTPEQFAGLWLAGGSKLTPEALNALVVRGEAMNRSLAAPAQQPATHTRFAWADFGVGLGAMAGAVLVLGGIGVAVRSGRRSSVAQTG